MGWMVEQLSPPHFMCFDNLNTIIRIVSILLCSNQLKAVQIGMHLFSHPTYISQLIVPEQEIFIYVCKQYSDQYKNMFIIIFLLCHHQKQTNFGFFLLVFFLL